MTLSSHRTAVPHRAQVVAAVVVMLAILTVGVAVWPGGSPSSAASTPAIVPVEPGRLLETRSGPGLSTVDGAGQGGGRVAAGGTIEVPVAGRHGVPADATAVMLNVTAVFPSALGFLTVFPCGEPQPGTSTVNYSAGQVVPNAALTKLGAGGKVCIYSLAETDVLVDVTAYVPAGGGVVPLVPARLLETRSDAGTGTIDGAGAGGGMVAAGGTVEVQVTGRHGVPADATAVMLNVTAVFPLAPGFLGVFPCGTERPGTSTVNYSAGQVVPNAVLTKVGAGGKVCIYSLATTHVLADITAFVPAGAAIDTLIPGRLLDTRGGAANPTVDGQHQGAEHLEGSGHIEVQVAGRYGIPADATAAMLNLTAVFPEDAGFLTLWPCGTERPNTSTVNYSAGQVVPNAALTKIGVGGKVCIYSLAPTDVLADVTAFVPAPSSGNGGTTTTTPGGTTTTTPGGTTTTAPEAPGGVGTFLDVGFYDQQLAVGPDGRFHLAHVDGAAERVWYGSCSADCDVPGNWQRVMVADHGSWGDSTIGVSGLGVDDSGRVHMVLDGVGDTDMLYATCTTNCSSAASWAFLDLSTEVGGTNTIGTNHSVMIEPSGRVSFVTAGPNAYYAGCDGSCTNVANWTAGYVINAYPLDAVVDGDGVTHVFLDAGADGNGNTLLQYARCTAGCTNPANWDFSALAFLLRSNKFTVAMAVSDSGELFLGYQQGALVPADVNDGRFVLNSCALSDCLDLNVWSAAAIGTSEAGTEGAWIEPVGAGALLVTVDGFDLSLRSCDGSCGSAANWSGPTTLDDSAGVGAAIHPATGSSCPGTSQSAAWWPYLPVAALGAAGLAVVHNPYAIVKCPFNAFPSRLPSIGRVITDF